MESHLTFLLTNDDGIYSPGLVALEESVRRLGKTVVVAPETERSASAHAINLSHPLRIKEVRIPEAFKGFACSGTPVDCVKIGVKTILRRKPDFVVCGINPGLNVGMDIIYSGTVSAALEGAILGIPSVAVSVAAGDSLRYDVAGDVALSVLRALMHMGQEVPAIPLNVNVPGLDGEHVRGYRITAQSSARFDETYEERRDTRGDSYFWLKGEMKAAGSSRSGDLEAVRRGYVSVTPLSLDLTDHACRDRLKRRLVFPM